MSDETTNDVTNLKTLQDLLAAITVETLKSNLTETLEKLETELSSSDIIQTYKTLMTELEHVNNLVSSLETVNQLLSKKCGIPVIVGTLSSRR